MRKFVSASSVLTVLVLLNGCGSLPCGDPHPYRADTAGPPLKAPPGLSAPIPDPAYAIPGEKPSTGKGTDQNASGACMVRPPRVITPESTIGPKPASDTGPQPAPASAAKPSQTKPSAPAPSAGTTAPPAVASGEPIG